MTHIEKNQQETRIRPDNASGPWKWSNRLCQRVKGGSPAEVSFEPGLRRGSRTLTLGIGHVDRGVDAWKLEVTGHSVRMLPSCVYGNTDLLLLSIISEVTVGPGMHQFPLDLPLAPSCPPPASALLWAQSTDPVR